MEHQSRGNKMSYCDNAKCTGHLGKFQDCESELAWEWSMDGGDASTGSVEFQGHVTLILVDESTTATLDAGTPNERAVAMRKGAYLVEDTNSGAVYAVHFDDPAEARKVFDEADRAYGNWLDADENAF